MSLALAQASEGGQRCPSAGARPGGDRRHSCWDRVGEDVWSNAGALTVRSFSGVTAFMSNPVAIVGYGAVGRGLHELFPDAVLYDEPLALGSREQVNRCPYDFVAVPTPASADVSCDASIVT